MAKNPRITTPVGVARYPRLNVPDTKFNSDGEYKVDLVVPSKEAKEFLTKVAALQKEAAAQSGTKKLADLPFKKEEDDNGKETGNIIIRCKAKNVRKKDGSLWDRKPTLFDREGRVYEEEVSIGGGSKLQVACEVFSIAVQGKQYVTLQPIAVMVHDLVEYTGAGDARGLGFDVKEGVADETVSSTDEVSDLF